MPNRHWDCSVAIKKRLYNYDHIECLDKRLYRVETKLAKLEAIIPTLATREDLAKHTTEIMDRIDRKFILCISIQMTTLFAIIGLLSKIANIF